MTAPAEPRFACDVMLGGVARWLRAAGYDATWQRDVADWDLIRLARHEGRVLLSSDTGIFRVGIVRDGDVPALFVPHGPTQEQLAFVLNELKMPLREPRCMACGGGLRDVPKEQARGRVPERSFAWQERFWECERCGKIIWKGTHWQRIAEELAAVRRGQAKEGGGGHESPAPRRP